jgi:hypothetical protein
VPVRYSTPCRKPRREAEKKRKASQNGRARITETGATISLFARTSTLPLVFRVTFVSCVRQLPSTWEEVELREEGEQEEERSKDQNADKTKTQ